MEAITIFGIWFNNHQTTEGWARTYFLADRGSKRLNEA
jgi:hypothetical protein